MQDNFFSFLLIFDSSILFSLVFSDTSEQEVLCIFLFLFFYSAISPFLSKFFTNIISPI